MALALLALTALLGAHAADVPQPAISLLSPQGIRFEVADIPGTTLVAFHYSINTPISGVQAGQWNFDAPSKSGAGTWIHENRNVAVKAGDTVYYWLHAVRNQLGYNLLNQQWKAGGGGGSVNPPAPAPSSGQLRLVMEDYFGSLDLGKWEHEVSLYGGFNWEFQAYTPENQNSYVRGNTLFLKPTLTSDRFGENFLRQGTWDMKAMYGRCTNDGNWGCLRQGQNAILNPVMSAKVTSKATIRYGRVEVLAKMPKGDWIWPAIWMLPRHSKYGGWPRSGEIDIIETIGNVNYGGLGIWDMGSTLHWGVDGGNNRWHMTHKKKAASGTSYADGFHKYVLDWTRDYIKIYVDDQLVLNVPTPNEGYFKWGNQPGQNIWASGDKSAPFDADFYLILNVAVGGTNGFIPDGLNNAGGAPKPWSNGDSNAPEKFWNAKNQWYPTWQGENAAMQVKYVKMWQLV